ncbi:hypothetical protein DDZ14_12270 [Maritimibacter sp. 55A14]|uniref:hypothetical protein n=1 Tax=Maritimibacter sp. 55A14 TaxID=2174844 RepID=UPI000D60C927|nr:hypothetical protein [Maritimibacter sp. 55A14]PWE31988.1 hypothetical protein DDZ14_12270 [Maritimibacter sp. 55A14]
MTIDMIKTFAKDESGAVTVDWVVLTAAVVGLGIIVLNAIEPATESLAQNIASSMAAAEN